ncbi:MAG: hypothetical protein EHM72_12845 [Calditrichaeota bacterium]|nr:MAG: hypothetical protein EHM72_12845 [Calditrichota bacterium]
MKRRMISRMKRLLLIVGGSLFLLAPSTKPAETTLHINPAQNHQTIEGFGVNINPAWWYNGDYGDAAVVQPAIDLLLDSLGATIVRAVIEEIDWEAVNDDDDPHHFNWNYYDGVFSNARFQGTWKTLRYLNQKGIRKNLMISFMGAPPASPPASPPMAAAEPQHSWLGGIDHSIDPAMEDEFVESLSALLYYARHKAGIDFNLVSPMNETDVISRSKSAEHPDGIVEGPHIPDAVQYVRITKKLALTLDAIGMSDIRFVAPDAAWDGLFDACLDETIKDSTLMSKYACWGVHQYGNDAANYQKIISRPANPLKSFWVTETAGIGNLLGQLDDDAAAFIFWDGFDCVYQHARRNGYGEVPPNDWAFWMGEEGKPLLAYNAADHTWTPRKPFYEFAQVFKFIKPGAVRIDATEEDSNLVAHAFCNPDKQLVIVGRNNGSAAMTLTGTISGVAATQALKVYRTSPTMNLERDSADLSIESGRFSLSVDAGTTFTLVGATSSETGMLPINDSGALASVASPADDLSNPHGQIDQEQASFSQGKPEPEGWYAGDIHVHRNCGEITGILAESEFTAMMETHDLAVITVLADMGNGEVKESRQDLPKVTGADAVQSLPGRIVHWDAEWHFDPAGVTFEHKALGGHLLLLGLGEAHTIWDESPYKILEWGKKQNAVVGFCHMQYLNDQIQNELNCCIPIDYPVEAALGTIDFLSEDVWVNDAAVNAYYKLLNCGFRLGWAAGTDYPCNDSRPFGSLLTYVHVPGQPLTYRRWIEGIKNGRTVVALNGHKEFLDLKVGDNAASPGDELHLNRNASLNIEVKWTSTEEQQGRIELISNGEVIAQVKGAASPGKPLLLKTPHSFTHSSWICARRMDDQGHQSHTAPVYVTINDAPVRASVNDAEFFVRWIDNILVNIEESGPWNQYFTHDIESVRERYRQARAVYQKIAREARERMRW